MPQLSSPSSLNSPLGQGGMATVHAWGDGFVLKLFRPGTTREQVEREAEQTRIVRDLGFPSPTVREVIAWRDQFGIVMERLDGPSLLQVLADRPNEVPRWAGEFADVQVGFHQLEAPGLPDQRERLRSDIAMAGALDAITKAAVLAHLDSLPLGNAVCHGDYHPLNVIATVDGLIAIDWYNATRGHPLADVARTVHLLRFTPVPRTTTNRQAIERSRTAFLEHYLAAYASQLPLNEHDLRAWSVPVAAARLAKEISPGEREFLVNIVTAGLRA